MSDETNHNGQPAGRHPDHFMAEWREYRGLSQEALGDMVGASRSKISRIENGETDLKASFLKKLAKIFHIPPVAILTINPLGEGQRTAEMLTLWDQMDTRKREDVLRIMQALASPADRPKTG